MNEFEWRRQLRELRQPVTPPPGLWSSIDAALSRVEHDPSASSEALPPQPARHPRRWFGAAIAASLLLAGGVAWHVMQVPASTPVAATEKPTTTWKPSDPRLAGAAIELNAAQMELKLALKQAPDSPALQRLLDRTQMQQTQLRQLARQAG